MNYEKNENCFVKTSTVRSRLVFGEESFIEKPLFTILIPTFKRPELLKDALNSVINQWHVSFPWDIVIVDNEADDGEQNDTEKLIRKINNPRVLYYRNSQQMRPGDNFNRGIFLSRGKWVMMLHDDDMLIPNSLQNMGRVIKLLEKNRKRPLGAVNAMYHQFKYDPEQKEKHWAEIYGVQSYYLSLPTNFWLYRLTHWTILFTGHIGGRVPSNGTTYNREAVIDTGGFNDDFGISADLILNYCLENKYEVYQTTIPYGFYRWGDNTMAKPEATYETIKAGFDFREYVYSQNVFTKIWGRLFRSAQYRSFSCDVIRQKKASEDVDLTLKDFDEIYAGRPNKHWYVFYSLAIRHIYEKIKHKQMKRLYKKSLGDNDLWE